jgi:hypothetical protein
MAMVTSREGASFTPNGVLRLDLDEKETDAALETARGVLLEIRAED